MRLCFIGDPRSVHTQRWVRWFAADHDVELIATVADEALADVTAAVLPASGPVRGLRLAASVRAVRRHVAATRPDVVHGHFINESGWFAAAAGARPSVITAWGSDLYRAPQESALARRLNPWAVRSVDRVTCDSEDQARVLRSWGVAADRVSVIGWGVDRREFHPGVDGRGWRAAHGIPEDAPVVLSPRQWLANSNVEAVVAAHARLPGDVHLVLKRMPRFEREAADRVRDAVAASSARDRITVVGEIADGQLPALYAAADVVVSLCTTDGTPVSVLEAMAVGRPVVALRNASLAEWVAAPGGALVEDLSPESIAQALGGFLTSAAARERAEAHNVDVVARRADRDAELGRMLDIYGRLARSQDGGRGAA